MRRVTTCLATAALCVAPPLAAQDAPPATDVYLVPLERTDRALRPGEPVNLTARPGYDNQPAFGPDGRHLYYTSYRDGQADVYRAVLPGGPVEAVTRTPESEYSPTLAPSGDLTVVRVEADSTQRLWRFTRRGEAIEPVLADVEPVGYHAWLDERRVALYVLGDPAELRVVDVETGEVNTVARRIGRSLQRIPGGGVSFVRFEEDDGNEAWLHRLSTDGRFTERLVRVPGEGTAGDHAWSPDGTVWTGVGARLHAWRPGDERERGFQPVVSLEAFGLDEITRMAVGPDGTWMAVVASDPQTGASR